MTLGGLPFLDNGQQTLEALNGVWKGLCFAPFLASYTRLDCGCSEST